LPGAFCFDLRGAVQNADQSASFGVVEKSFGDTGARVMRLSLKVNKTGCVS
jgi:hypothetical protein